jgi:Uma2 family endonuclease
VTSPSDTSDWTEHLVDLTWDEFLALPFETRNAALVDGKVHVNAPSAMHELVVRNLVSALAAYGRAEPGRGEPSTQQPVRITDRRGYQPDVMWYPGAQCAPAGEPPSFTGLPAIVAEVFSPSTRRFDAIRKRRDYEDVGIGEVWFCDPEESAVLVLRRSMPGERYDVTIELDADALLTSSILPGFEVGVASLFAR